MNHSKEVDDDEDFVVFAFSQREREENERLVQVRFEFFNVHSEGSFEGKIAIC